MGCQIYIWKFNALKKNLRCSNKYYDITKVKYVIVSDCIFTLNLKIMQIWKHLMTRLILSRNSI